MTITISLPPETEQKLLQAAAQNGLGPDVLAQRLIEQGLNGGPSADQTSPGRPGIMAKLKSIKIEAPADFAANFDQYASGEKRVEDNLH
jgi:hypothetical protein